MSDKKIDYNTPARKQASKRYDSKFSKITIRLPLDLKQEVYEHIEKNGYNSMNAFIIELFNRELGKLEK